MSCWHCKAKLLLIKISTYETMHLCECYKEEVLRRPTARSNPGKRETSEKQHSKRLLPCVWRAITHMDTDIQSCPSLVPDRSGLCCARRPHIHPSALYCSFHCGNGKSQCGTEGGGNGGQDPRALQGLAMVGIPLLTHTFTHGHYHTQPGFIARSKGGELSHCPKKQKNKTRCPCIPSNCRKSSTCRSHLVKYLRFRSHRDHLIQE